MRAQSDPNKPAAVQEQNKLPQLWPCL
jgi:hypothetical protein